jgi:type I restriction enzyme S subunit
VVNHLAALIPTQRCVTSFLKYWLQANSPSRLIQDSSYPSIRLSDISDVEIPLPPLDEQRRIAAILDKADGIRRKRQASISLTEDLLRSVFLDMFADPVMNPKGWDIRKFADVGTLDHGVSKNRPRNAPELLGGLYPLIQTGDVANSDGYIRSHKSTYSEAGLSQSKMWPAGTLCITIAANIAKTGILTFDACFPDSVVGFTPNKLTTTEYVQYWLGFLQKNLEDNAPESAQKNINLDILRKLNIPVPDIELQKEFTQRVKATQDIKAKLASASDQQTQLFESLSQRAFRGEL